MKEIPLTQGKVALIDDNDYEKLSQYNWYLKKRPNANCVSLYAMAKINGKDIFMHKFMNPNFKMTDHIDSNGLNNQRYNLRECTVQQNVCNRRRMKPFYLSKYKGVSLYKRTKRWRAKIRHNGKDYHLGYTFFEVVAAKLYDYWAKKFHGEFANINGV